MRLFSKTKLIIFSIILSLLMPILCFASPIEDKTYKQNEIIQSINIKQAELDELSNEYTTAIIEKENLEKELEFINNEIKDLEEQEKEVQKNLEQQCKDKYCTDQFTIIDVLLNSSDFETLIFNIDYYDKFLVQTDNTLNKLKNLKSELKIEKEKQEEKQNELVIRIQEIEDSKKYAEDCINELQNQYSKLDEEIILLILQQQLIDSQSINIYEENIDLSENNLSAYIYQNVEKKINISGNDIVERAYSMLGSPYSWGGTTANGFDCSGFVSYCLSGEEGTRLGTTADFANWTQTSNPQPGDVCVVHNGNSQHTGIYIGDGNMIHAATYGIGVIESPVQDGMIYVIYSG